MDGGENETQGYAGKNGKNWKREETLREKL